MNSKNDTSAGFGCLVLLIIMGAICYGAYTGLDSMGWISHTDLTEITAQNNWFVGESKDCFSVPLDPQTAGQMNKSPGDAVSDINCDNGHKHTVKITFYGRTIQTEYKFVGWNCTRNEVSLIDASAFTCKQTGGW